MLQALHPWIGMPLVLGDLQDQMDRVWPCITWGKIWTAPYPARRHRSIPSQILKHHQLQEHFSVSPSRPGCTSVSSLRAQDILQQQQQQQHDLSEYLLWIIYGQVVPKPSSSLIPCILKGCWRSVPGQERWGVPRGCLPVGLCPSPLSVWYLKCSWTSSQITDVINLIPAAHWPYTCVPCQLLHKVPMALTGILGTSPRESRKGWDPPAFGPFPGTWMLRTSWAKVWICVSLPSPTIHWTGFPSPHWSLRSSAQCSSPTTTPYHYLHCSLPKVWFRASLQSISKMLLMPKYF